MAHRTFPSSTLADRKLAYACPDGKLFHRPQFSVFFHGLLWKSGFQLSVFLQNELFGNYVPGQQDKFPKEAGVNIILTGESASRQASYLVLV